MTCWEIFSGGRTPYPGMDTHLLSQMLDGGQRLNMPLNAACPDEMYVTISMIHLIILPSIAILRTETRALGLGLHYLTKHFLPYKMNVCFQQNYLVTFKCVTYNNIKKKNEQAKLNYLYLHLSL